MTQKQMKKIGTMKVRWYDEVISAMVYESWTGVRCIRKKDIRPSWKGGTGGMCYYRLKQGPGPRALLWGTHWGMVYDPPLTPEQKKKSKAKKSRKESRREKLLEKLLTHLTKTERKQLAEGKIRFSHEELGL